MDGILRKRDDVVFRKIGNEYILVPMAASSDEVESIFNLNVTGALIWEKIDGERRIKDIVEEIQSEYDEGAERLEKDVVVFIDELIGAKLVMVT